MVQTVAYLVRLDLPSHLSGLISRDPFSLFHPLQPPTLASLLFIQVGQVPSGPLHLLSLLPGTPAFLIPTSFLSEALSDHPL